MINESNKMGLNSNMSISYISFWLLCGVTVCYFTGQAVVLYLHRRSTRLSPNSGYCVVPEKDVLVQRMKVPGSSTAYYTGDPATDILVVEAFNATSEVSSTGIKGTFQLKGKITRPIGHNPRMVLNLYLNGRWGKEGNTKFEADGTHNLGKLSIVQNGEELPAGTVPTEGDIVITTWNALPLAWTKKGWWSARVEINASQEIGARLTGFEGGTWIEGHVGDGCGGPDSDRAIEELLDLDV